MGNYDRQKRYQKSRSEDPEYRKKESNRVNELKKSRRQAMTDEEKEEDKLKKREYMKSYRMKKKILKIRINSNPPSTSEEAVGLFPRSTIKRKTGFRAKPSLMKAVKKLLVTAPTSPAKRKGAELRSTFVRC